LKKSTANTASRCGLAVTVFTLLVLKRALPLDALCVTFDQTWGM
jgi:hypothetical protein